MGRRFARMVAVKANIDPKRRAGELTEEEMKKIIDIISKPLEYDLPQWVVNRKKDLKDGSYTQQVANGWDTKIREDLEKMKKLNYIKVLDITSDLKSEDNILILPEEEEKLSGFQELKLNKTK